MIRNLFDAPIPETGELFETLLENGNVHIELIVSSDTPDERLYNQPHDEAVLLIEGRASLEMGGTLIELKSGDFTLIPADTPHRVVKTTKGCRWLAIHIRK